MQNTQFIFNKQRDTKYIHKHTEYFRETQKKRHGKHKPDYAEL